RQATVLVPAVPDAEDDHVPLVTLHILQILDEEPFEAILLEEVFKSGIRPAAPLGLIYNCCHLCLAESNYTDTFLGILREVCENSICHNLRLALVNAPPTSVVYAIREVEEFDPECLMVMVGRRERNQSAMIEAMVGEGDERL